MSVYAVVKRALGIEEPPQPQPALAQITIISTQAPKRPSGTRSPQSRA